MNGTTHKSVDFRGFFRLGALFVALGIFGIAGVAAQEEATEFPSAEAGQDLSVPGGEPAPPEVPPGPDLTEANELITAEEYEKADEVLAAVLAEFPDDPGTLFMRGEVLLALGRPEDARPLLEKTVELDPERLRAHFQLGAALQAAGEAEAALAAFAREIELNEEPQVQIMARMNCSIIYEQQQKWDQAAAEMEAIITIDPDDPRSYGDLASLYLQAGELEKVTDVLVRGVEAGFSSPQHYYILGSRYYRKEAYEQAAEAFADALELNSNFPDAEKSLGGTLQKLDRNQDAALHFKRYLELVPDAPDAKEIKKHIAELEKG
jgi:tetratricopeptide (TPR) repeat protein